MLVWEVWVHNGVSEIRRMPGTQSLLSSLQWRLKWSLLFGDYIILFMFHIWHFFWAASPFFGVCVLWQSFKDSSRILYSFLCLVSSHLMQVRFLPAKNFLDLNNAVWYISGLLYTFLCEMLLFKSSFQSFQVSRANMQHILKLYLSRQGMKKTDDIVSAYERLLVPFRRQQKTDMVQWHYDASPCWHQNTREWRGL